MNTLKTAFVGFLILMGVTVVVAYAFHALTFTAFVACAMIARVFGL